MNSRFWRVLVISGLIALTTLVVVTVFFNSDSNNAVTLPAKTPAIVETTNNNPPRSSVSIPNKEEDGEIAIMEVSLNPVH